MTTDFDKRLATSIANLKHSLASFANLESSWSHVGGELRELTSRKLRAEQLAESLEDLATRMTWQGGDLMKLHTNCQFIKKNYPMIKAVELNEAYQAKLRETREEFVATLSKLARPSSNNSPTKASSQSSSSSSPDLLTKSRELATLLLSVGDDAEKLFVDCNVRVPSLPTATIPPLHLETIRSFPTVIVPELKTLATAVFSDFPAVGRSAFKRAAAGNTKALMENLLSMSARFTSVGNGGNSTTTNSLTPADIPGIRALFTQIRVVKETSALVRNSMLATSGCEDSIQLWESYCEKLKFEAQRVLRRALDIPVISASSASSSTSASAKTHTVEPSVVLIFSLANDLDESPAPPVLEAAATAKILAGRGRLAPPEQILLELNSFDYIVGRLDDDYVLRYDLLAKLSEAKTALSDYVIKQGKWGFKPTRRFEVANPVLKTELKLLLFKALKAASSVGSNPTPGPSVTFSLGGETSSSVRGGAPPASSSTTTTTTNAAATTTDDESLRKIVAGWFA